MTATGTRIGDAADAAQEAMRSTADYVNTTTERLRDEAATTERRARELIEEYPLTCFFGAVVTGYLIGRIATRL